MEVIILPAFLVAVTAALTQLAEGALLAVTVYLVARKDGNDKK